MKIIKPDFWKYNNLITFILWPLTIITKMFIFFKNLKKKYEINVPSICVGNIYIGGTGKTQLVIKINQILRKKFKTIVIKKKYKNQLDEQILLKKQTRLILPNNRFEGVNKVKNLKNTVLIFDDGLQDDLLKYKLSIVCFNSFAGIGNGKLIPAGPLRENLSALQKYDAVFINGKKNSNLINKIKAQNKKIKIFSGKYILKNKKKLNIKSKYLAFCGIGTPENFFNLLKENRIQVKNKIIFPDHYSYKSSDIEKIINIAKNSNLKILTTEKDYVKVIKFKNTKIKFTEIDYYINDYNNFKKYLIKNI